MMKNYLLKIVLFGLPVMVFPLLVLLIDPYNFVNAFHVVNDSDKYKVIQRCDESSPRGNLLWKMICYKRQPLPCIIIGDSQGKDIRTDLIADITGETYSNLCVPGASYNTMFDLFWFAAAQTDLKKAWFQVSFMNFNTQRSYNLFCAADKFMKYPYLYFTTKEIYVDAFYNVAWAVTRNPHLISKSYEFLPENKMEELSRSRLHLFFDSYSYPDNFVEEFRKVSQYCDKQGIELNFIILPVYVEVDNYLKKVGLDEERAQFKSDIKALGHTIDLDSESPLKNSRLNFFDYFHPKKAVMDSLTIEVWSNCVLQ